MSEWDEAIQEAEKQIKTLKKAVRVFTEYRDAEIEWPGFKKSAPDSPSRADDALAGLSESGSSGV